MQREGSWGHLISYDDARFLFPPPRKTLMQYQFEVHGMTCGHCERAVIEALQTLDPQASVRVDRAQNRVEVESEQPREALVAAITEEGYRVAP